MKLESPPGSREHQADSKQYVGSLTFLSESMLPRGGAGDGKAQRTKPSDCDD